MFKLESYITPWLLGYLDQYVNLRPEDLQLSLWGGDAVLYNLDLRLDMLQQAMHLPIVFKSGHIHELRLHVPWTKLGSEPLVITINTVECVVKVRDLSSSDSASSSSVKSSVTSRSRRRIKRQAADDLPPGYLQSILNRVVNNVTFIVNNLILKFVEDDIVLSVNVKSAECYSCDRNWNRAFVDVSHQDLSLRRIINLCDLTVCLDKTNSDGHIENYQEPVLYRCFIACRLHMTYESVNAKVASQTKVNLMCERLEGLLSDTQLPMFLRLIELCLALYYGYLDDEKGSSSVSGNKVDSTDANEVEMPKSTEEEDMDSQGWASWVWSMVPQILPEDEEDENGVTSNHHHPPVLSLGFYFNHLSLTFKLSVASSREKSRSHIDRLTFHPFLMLEAQGIGLEILMQGLTFFDVQLGIQHLSLASCGECICGQPADNLHTLLDCGLPMPGRQMTYDQGSLFDPLCPQNCGLRGSYVLSGDEHLEQFTEEYCQQRFAAFWMDYLSTAQLPQEHTSGSQSSESEETNGLQQESTVCRFVFGPCLINVTSSSIHRIQKVICCAQNYHYEPYKRSQEEAGERVKVTEEQLLELEKGVPTVSYYLTLLQPTLALPPACHPHCNVPARRYRPQTHRHPAKASKAKQERLTEAEVELCASAQRIDVQRTSPMYPAQLVRLVSNVAGPSSTLMHHCHSHMQFKVFSLQAGLKQPVQTDSKSSHPVLLLPPCNFALYFRSLLLPQCWINSYLALQERSLEVPQANLTLSRASLEATVRLLATWTAQSGQQPPVLQPDSLISDLFPGHGQEATPLSVLELTVGGVYLQNCCTPLVHACTGRISTVQLQLYTPGKGDAALTAAIVSGPFDSSDIKDMPNLQHNLVSCAADDTDFVVFTMQIPCQLSVIEAPAVLVARIQGVGVCLDPALLAWYSYRPRSLGLKYAAEVPSTAVDIPLAQATSPLETGGSNVSVRSGSSFTPHTSSRLYSVSQAQSCTVSGREDVADHDRPAARDKVSAADSFTTQMVSLFPLLRILHMQVDMKSSCLFVPSTSLAAQEASSDMASNVHCAWLQGGAGDVVVVCLPALGVHSVSSSPVDVELDLPITSLNGALLSEKLPWTIELGDWNAFTLHAGGQLCPWFSGLGVTSTWGATAQYSPPTSDTIHSLALCLHLDMHPLHVALSHIQVRALHSGLRLALAAIENTACLVSQCHSQLALNTASHPHTFSGDGDSPGLRLKHSDCPVHEPSPSLTTEEMGEAMTTDMSDDLSQQHSPLHKMVGGDGAPAARLSLWLQCVLPRVALALTVPNTLSEVFLVLEDVALSCDVQHIYCKVKSTVGSMVVHNFTGSDAGQRLPDPECPVLLSTSSHLPQDVVVHTNRPWASDHSPARSLFSPKPSSPADKLHGFFSLTYTCAQSRNVRQKMKTLNVDLAGAGEKVEGQSSDCFYFEDLVSEVCAKVEPLDLVLHLPIMQNLLELLSQSSHHLQHGGLDSGVTAHVRNSAAFTKAPATSTATYNLPLLHIDVGAIRVFVPVLGVSSAKDGEEVAGLSREGVAGLSGEGVAGLSTMNHDLLLLHITGVHVQPHADNPLARYAINKEVYQRALLTGMTRHMGSCVQDRQFQVQMSGLALSSGTWSNVLEVMNEKEKQRKQMTPGIQIPALEWNIYLGHRVGVPEVEMFPIVCGFGMCIVLAPPIIFTPLHTKQAVMVCGPSVELNVTSDLDISLSAQQLHLLTRAAALSQSISGTYNTSTSVEQRTVKGGSISRDSAITSEASFSMSACGDHGRRAHQLQHAHLLLTAGHISLTVYSHVQMPAAGNCAARVAPRSAPLERTPVTTQRSRHEADNFSSLTRGMPGKAYSGGEPLGHEFTFLQRPADQDLDVDNADGGGLVCVQPLVYAYISQPHTVISTWPQQEKLELSFYDFILKGAPRNFRFSVNKQRVMPDHADFSLHLVETRAGLPDRKTGIPPCLLTLHITSFLQGPATVDVKLERPLSISLSSDAASQVSDFLREAFAAGQDTGRMAVVSQQVSTGDTPADSSAWLSEFKSRISRISLQSDQVVMSLECCHSGSTSRLVSGIGAVHLSLETIKDAGEGFQVQSNVGLKDLLLKVMYGHMDHPLAGPVSIDLTTLMQWPESGQWTMPQLVVTMQTSLLLAHLAPDTCLGLQHWLQGVLPQQSGNETDTGQKEGQSKAGGLLPGPLLTTVRPSMDDLRSGSFVFSNASDGSELPGAGLALLSVGEVEDGVDSMLTWAYPHPRTIASITTQPVPLASQLATASKAAHAVKCWLQYWDLCLECFVTYATFVVRDDAASAAALPVLELDSVRSLAQSCVWRVVVVASPAGGQLTARSQQPNDRGSGCLLAAQLAGSMCVDSVSLPTLLPWLQLLVSVPHISLHLYTHSTTTSLAFCGELKGYSVPEPSARDQEWAVFSVDKLSLLSRCTGPPLTQTSCQISCNCGVSVVDYSSLALQSLVDPVDLTINLRLQQFQKPSIVECDIGSSIVQVNVNRSTLYTISTALSSWSQSLSGSCSSGPILMGHIIICNNTYNTIHVGQCNTDENLVLQSGHLMDYSWRSCSTPQQLHMCLDHATWRWCAPIDISTDGQFVRVVRSKDQCYTLIIKVKCISSVLKKVMVDGQYVVRSHLSQAVELQLQTRSLGCEVPTVLEAGACSRTLVVEHEAMVGVCVRLAGYPLPWSDVVHLGGHAQHASQPLKMFLPDGVSFFHVWCRVVSQSVGETRQKLIMLSPLYVLRSHLPLPLLVCLHSPTAPGSPTAAGSPAAAHTQHLQVPGHGLPYQLHCPGGQVLHHLSFQLGVELPESSPAVELSCSLIDQVRRQDVVDVDIEALCSQQGVESSVQWPYSILPEDRASDSLHCQSIDQCSIDVNVQLSEYMAGCNTLLVDIAPWCLLTNVCPLTLRLTIGQRSFTLPQGTVIAPPPFEELSLSCEDDQGSSKCSVCLSQDEVEQHRYSSHLASHLFLDGYVHCQLITTSSGSSQVIPLSILSSVHQGIRTITISERLRLVNMSDWVLDCRLLAVADTPRAVSACPTDTQLFSVAKSEHQPSAVPLLFWSLLPAGLIDPPPADVVLYMVFRQQTSGSADPGSWTVPVRVVSAQTGWRSTVAHTSPAGRPLSLCVTCTVHGPHLFVTLTQDNTPMCCLHNLCPFTLQFGQAVQQHSFHEKTVIEESELLPAVPSLASGSYCLYTMPVVNTRFPAVDPGNLPYFHIRAWLSGPEEWSAWSSAVPLDVGEHFVQLPNAGSVKVSLRVVAMVRHITLTVLNKAEVSAQEVYNRIPGRLAVITSGHREHTAESAGAGPLVESCMPQSEARPRTTALRLCLKVDRLLLSLEAGDSGSSKGGSSSMRQLLLVEVQHLLATCYPVGAACTSGSLCLALCLGSLRLDNPQAYQGLYDFPVVLQPQQSRATAWPPRDDMDLSQFHAVVREESFVYVQAVLEIDPLLRDAYFLHSVEGAVKPLEVYLEDSYFYFLQQELTTLVPRTPSKQWQDQTVPTAIVEKAYLHRQPLRIQHLIVHPINVQLSVHACMKLFLSIDHAPLSLARFERQDLFTGTQQLAYTMALHYITAAVFRAGLVVGSLDILGSPTGLVRSVSTGLIDLLFLPYRGLTHSPGAFLTGIYGGVSSLVRNVTAGFVTSVTNFAWSVSRNMDHLSMDPSHQQRQDENRRRKPTGVSTGLQQGLTGFGLSLLGAVAGLVDQPLQSVMAPNSAGQARSNTRAAGGLVAGLGKGLVGAIAKPIGGAAELVAQTGHGLLQVSGLKHQIQPLLRSPELSPSHPLMSWFKYQMKLLPDTKLLCAVGAVCEGKEDGEGEVVLVLTGELVMVISQQQDAQQQAFALSQLSCQSPAPAILTFIVVDQHSQISDFANKTDRVAAFISSTTMTHSRLSPEPQDTRSAGKDGPGVDPTCDDALAVKPASYSFRADPYWVQLFVALFHMARQQCMGRGFSL